MADNNARNINIISYIKACVISLIITLVLILVFALILKFTSVPNSAIAPINMMIKAISVAIGAIILTFLLFHLSFSLLWLALSQ